MAFYEVRLTNGTSIRVSAYSKFQARWIAQERIGNRRIGVVCADLLPFVSPMQRYDNHGNIYCARRKGE